MRFEILHDSGTAEFIEDIAIVYPPFFGVADGVSGLYLPDDGPETFDGLTGGQMAARELQRVVMLASPNDSLEAIICEANRAIRRKNKEAGVSSERVEQMAGAAFVLAKIEEKSAKIIQGGDCSAIWISKQTGITPNRALSHDQQCRKFIAELMVKHQGDRAKMWQEFAPHLAMLRRKHINRHHEAHGFCLLNGQKEMENFWDTFFIKDPTFLVLSSDGFCNYSNPLDEAQLIDRITKVCMCSGLRGALHEKRLREEKEKARSHVDYAEATAVAITF